MMRKVNLEIGLSRNFNTVKVGLVDEPIDYSDEDDFKIKIHALLTRLREVAGEQHYLIGGEGR